MNSYFAMLATAVVIGWAQGGMDRQGNAGSWYSPPIISGLH